MAFITIDDDEIKVGEPVKRALLKKISDNLDYLEQAVVGVEEVGVFDVFNLTVVSPKNIDVINEKLPVFKARTNTRLTGFRLGFPSVYLGATVNTTGTLQIQLQKSTDGGTNWNNVLSSPIEATTQEIGDEITGLTFVSGGDELDAGDMLRFRYVAGQIRTLEPNHHLLLTGETI
jgi:hypothetical protein